MLLNNLNTAPAPQCNLLA